MIACLIVDDEPLAVELMSDNISRVPFLKLEGQANSVAEAMTIMNEKHIDLIFLDIEMPDVSGIAFLKMQQTRPMVILTTAWEHYALESYHLDVIDYLLKPISFERFLKAVSKASSYHQFLSAKAAKTHEPLRHLFVKSEHRIVKISIDEILFIESMKDYVKIFCGPKPVFSLMSLRQIESLLPENEFVRVHRSYIVAIGKIDFVGKSKVNIGTMSIPVSNFYRDAFFGRLGQGSDA